MKKIICIVLAVSLIAVSAVLFAGCGEDKSKTKETTKATESATSATDATVPTSVISTVAPGTIETLAPQGDDETAAATEAGQSDDGTEQDYYSAYGGLSGQDAILKALGAIGAGYQCVSYDRRYLHNQEAWYIGVQASDGSDNTVYYLYVNENTCAPVTEIPNIGGNNSEDSGVFDDTYAGISEQEAIFTALNAVEGEYTCVSSEQTTSSGSEYWLVGVQQTDDPSADILYFYVNASHCFQQ